MLLPLFGQGSPATNVDLSDALAEIYPLLNAASAADLVWWSDSELYQWADEAAQRLARRFGVFVERDASGSIVEGTASYGVPLRHVSTIHVSIAGVALGPSSVEEIEARDANWVDTSAASDSWLWEAGTDYTRIYPTPDDTVTGSLARIFHRYPATIDSSNYLISIPAAIRDYISWFILAEAHKKESEGRKPEVGAHFENRLGLMEKVIESYWGLAQ